MSQQPPRSGAAAGDETARGDVASAVAVEVTQSQVGEELLGGVQVRPCTRASAGIPPRLSGRQKQVVTSVAVEVAAAEAFRAVDPDAVVSLVDSSLGLLDRVAKVGVGEDIGDHERS